MTQALSAGEYLVGLGIFTAIIGSATLSAIIGVRRWLPWLTGSVRLTATAVVTVGVIIAVHVACGAVGLLTRWAVLVAALLVLAAVSRFGRALARGDLEVPPADGPPADGPPRSSRGLWLIAGVAVLAVASVEVASAWKASANPSTQIDTLTFHLPTVVRWIQRGSMWPVNQFVPVWSMGNYPNSGDVLTLAAVLPWRADSFARFMNFPMFALGGLSVYALAIELGARRAMAVLAATVCVSIPSTVSIANSTTMPDIAMVAMLTAGVLFLVRSLRTHRLSDITLGALAAGLAFGMKWNGVADAVVLGAWALFMLARDRQPRRLLRPLLALPAIILGAGGFWLLRNALEAGNPVIPVRVSFLGLNAPRDEIRECVGFPVAHYLTSSHAWSTFILPGYRRFLGAPAALIVAGLLLALLVNRRAPMRIGLLTLVGVLVVVYMITPYSALGLRDQPVGVGVQARYLLPALAIAAAVAGAAFGTLRRRGTWIAGTCALIVVALGLRSGLELQRGENVDVGAGLVAAVGVALLGAAGCAALVRARLPLTRRRSAAIVAVGVLALAGAAVGYSRQQTFFENRYQGGEPAIRWINTHATAGHRIALAGLWDTAGLTPVLPAYGPRFRNVAQYVAPAQQTVLRDYGTKSAWLGALRSGRYDLVLVGRGGYAPTCAVPGSHSDKDAWARDAGFPVVARSSRLTLYRVEF